MRCLLYGKALMSKRNEIIMIAKLVHIPIKGIRVYNKATVVFMNTT